jgi:tellurite methyltransferase
VKPFWEESYGDPDNSPFGPASDEIADLAPRLPPGATILDLGCGDGRNSLYLARQGFAVDAFDISAKGIAALRSVARRERLAVRARVQDIRDFVFEHSYDLVICHGVLHLLDPGTSAEVIRAMRANTVTGGWNVVVVFTDAAPVPPDLAPHVRGLFVSGELFSRYRDWDIEAALSYMLDDEHPGGIRHRHAIDKLVARRV